MPPSLRVSAGPSLSNLTLISPNSEDLLTIDSPLFQGRVAVRIKGFHGVVPEGKERVEDTKYFDGGHAKGCTWSIAFQGRFLRDVNGDEVVWGNQFEKPIKDKLPYGTAIGLKAVHAIDPTLKEDLYADRPWAFSPFVATMTRINVKRLASEPSFKDASEALSSSDWPAFPHGEGHSQSEAEAYVQDDTSSLLLEPGSNAILQSIEDEGVADFGTVNDLKSSNPKAYAARAKFFHTEDNRSLVQFRKNDIVTASWDLGFIDFNDLSLSLPYTGMKFQLSQYWDGQPVTYYLKSLKTDEVFLVVQFNIVDLDA